MNIQIQFLFLAISALACLCLQAGCMNQKPCGHDEHFHGTHPNGYPTTVSFGAELTVVYSDPEAFFEGPTWNPAANELLFTAWFKKRRQILKLSNTGKVSIWSDHSDGANGTFLSNDGRLLTAEVSSHRVGSYRIDADGPADPRIMAAGPKWNQPNDVCQSSRGDIYFTDPNYRQRELSNVYHLGLDGQVSLIISDMALPNGIVTNKDASVLYISDSFRKHWRSYDLMPDGTLRPGGGRVFFEPETENTNDPDGMAIDECDNLYFTGRGGVWAVSPEGEQLGFIAIPEFCSNLAFGGADGRTLFITCRGKVYSLAMTVRGGGSARFDSK